MTICKISLLAMASNILLGNTCSTKLMMLKVWVLPITSLAPFKSALLKSIPKPGLKIFTKTRPINKLIRDAVINQIIAFPPTLPTVFRSPSLAIPTTNVVNTSGAMIICTNLKNMVVKSLMFFEKLSMVAASAFSCTKYPKIAPAIIAITMYTVSKFDFFIT